MEFVQELYVGEMKPYAKQIQFGEDGRVLVGGSDCGKVYVFDRKTGLIVDSLSHDDHGLAQAIAVSLLSFCDKVLMSRRQTVGTASIPL
jgi:hypothetical protein